MRNQESFSRYDVYTTAGSLYCYRETGTLINRFNIRDAARLKTVEADIFAVKQNSLLNNPIKGRLSINHLCNIHKYFFGDLYYFAGHFRRENIMKGKTLFADKNEIKPKLEKLFTELKHENYLKNLDRENLVKRSSCYLAELNYIHPFREGNGRTSREFMRILFSRCGYEIEWSAVTKEQFLNAAEWSVYDSTKLEPIISKCLK